MEDCAEPQQPRKAGILAKMAGECAERLAGYVFDEAKAAVIAKIAEATACDPDADQRSEDAEVTAAFAHCFCQDLPVQLPKVAKPRTVSDPEAKESWPLTLPDAIRIALITARSSGSSPSGPGIPIGGFEPTALKAGTPANDRRPNPKPNPIVIARLNSDASEWRFKAEIMAEVRSVEQQYWSLAQTHVQLWTADRAVGMAKKSSIASRLTCRLVVAPWPMSPRPPSDSNSSTWTWSRGPRTIITTERQLRNLLGLPPSDNRKIIPVTPATDLASSRLGFLPARDDGQQPDIAQQKVLVRVAEMQLLIARNQLLPRLSLDALYQLNALGNNWIRPLPP